MESQNKLQSKSPSKSSNNKKYSNKSPNSNSVNNCFESPSKNNVIKLGKNRSPYWM